jgi:hypothetical protein
VLEIKYNVYLKKIKISDWNLLYFQFVSFVFLSFFHPFSFPFFLFVFFFFIPFPLHSFLFYAHPSLFHFLLYFCPFIFLLSFIISKFCSLLAKIVRFFHSSIFKEKKRKGEVSSIPKFKKIPAALSTYHFSKFHYLEVKIQVQEMS